MDRGKYSILLVEDDDNLGFVIKDSLELYGYKVDLYQNGEVAQEAFFSKKYDLCLFDVMLPVRDGFNLAKNIRQLDQNTPILFLTARSQKEDKIEGFRSGGDDYILKPFHVDELLLRIEVFLKRRHIESADQKTIQLGNISLNILQHSLDCNGQVVNLTDKETQLMRILIEQQGQVVKREDILKKIWGDDDYFLGRSLDVFISRLRKYLKTCPDIIIRNVHGVGFCLMRTSADPHQFSN